jgi:hypothetical protein
MGWTNEMMFEIEFRVAGRNAMAAEMTADVRN